MLALELVSDPARAAYGRFASTPDLDPIDVDVDPGLLRLLALRHSPLRSKLKVEVEGGQARLVVETERRM